ncbi:MAG: hypothetical protein EAZ21_12675 [Betaproteobacteria bacterium]|nr:MAG: hypothetical protein EAZ21_12675 [Betaproteobacteria bacterium]
MCSGIAITSEHRLKKSDLRRLYGEGPFSGDDRLHHIRGDSRTRISGANSKVVKYEKNICLACNSKRSQPYDMAYDRLIHWLLENESDVLRKRFLNFADVYGYTEFEASQRNLYKYFAKSFGCRVNEASRVVPSDVCELFDKERFETGLRITFSVNEQVAANEYPRTVGNGPLHEWQSPDTGDARPGYTCSQFFSWFTVYFWYCIEPDGNLGSTWVANSQHVYLGSL